MSEWERVALGKVTSQSKDRVKVDPNTEYPMLGVRWYAQGAFHRETVTPKAATVYRTKPGQFIYNRLFAWKGSFALVTPDLDATYVSNEFPLFDCDPERLMPEYLWYFFGQTSLWDEIARVSTGTTATSRNRWNEAQFNAYMIPLPPPPEQRRIVAVMSAVDAHIAASAAQIEATHTVADRRLKDMLNAKEHWVSRSISDCATLVTGRAFPATYQGSASGDFPYVKVSDLGSAGDQRCVTTAANWVSALTAQKLTARVCPAGTVLFPIIGAAMLTEKRRILGCSAVFDQNVMGLIPRDDIIAEFLFAVMSSIRLGDLRQSGAVPSVNQVLVGGIKIFVPPEEDEQRKIADAHDRVLDVIDSCAVELAALRRVRSELLTALVLQEIAVDKAVDQFVERAA
jgi:type I restriction enzyme, S subunit